MARSTAIHRTRVIVCLEHLLVGLTADEEMIDSMMIRFDSFIPINGHAGSAFGFEFLWVKKLTCVAPALLESKVDAAIVLTPHGLLSINVGRRVRHRVEKDRYSSGAAAILDHRCFCFDFAFFGSCKTRKRATCKCCSAYYYYYDYYY
jgi:hypothetical protein